MKKIAVKMIRKFIAYITLVLLITTFIIGFACEKQSQKKEADINICGTENPQWIIEMIDDVSENSAYYVGTKLIEYQCSSGYYYYLEVPISSCAYCTVYDCDGNLVEFDDKYTIGDFTNSIQFQKTIWSWPEY